MSLPRAELLAPAGDRAALAAALAAGADAVYFGLDEGFNARARAPNFPLADLPATCARIHRAGARAYLALNTLVFEGELARAEELVRAAAAAGVDALIVQDPAVALLARAVCPGLEVHASTQMTVCYADAARFAARLGITRVVVPRELSVQEIVRFRAESDLEVEVFVHGALCVSWSGQCLTSATFGGRSANRGQCAQSCRMPYDLVLDGARRDLGDVHYLLSPKDLAGARVLPDLLAAGVHGLKIEGRQKGPEYVATAVAGYRRWLDALASGADRASAEQRLALDLRDMASAFSRGFGEGFLRGSDHQRLVEGRFPKHRGHLLGKVVAVAHDEVVVTPDGEGRQAHAGDLPLPDLRPGLGVGFDLGRPEEEEPGGLVCGVAHDGSRVRLRFPRTVDLARVRPGARVWITSDPAVHGTGPDAEPEGRIALELAVAGAAGTPLSVVARAAHARAEARSTTALAPARGAGLDDAVLRAKLGAFGGTPFRLVALAADGLAPGLHLPVSELKELRRALLAGLLPQIERGPARAIDPAPALPRVRAASGAGRTRWQPPAVPQLVPLVRTDEQLGAALAAGVAEVELDWMELAGLGRAVERARAHGVSVVVATLRVTKPGERQFDERLLKLRPDGILVRHLGAAMLFADLPEGDRPILHGDFALNVCNSVTAAQLFAVGLDTLTPAHDLDRVQLAALLRACDAARFTATVHLRMPMFHTEHCVYAHLLSDGRDFRSCGRPCERHAIALRDHVGCEHPVLVDAGCRNTVFHGNPQTSAKVVGDLLDAGVRRFRVELVRESAAETTAVLAHYGRLLRGEATPAEVQRALRARAHVGVAARAQETAAPR